MAENSKVTMVKTLSLTGVSVNAMALIAPGAFLWITFQVQVGQTVPGGTASTALEMWPGLFFAFILAFLTALSYSELARIFPRPAPGAATTSPRRRSWTRRIRSTTAGRVWPSW